MKILINSLEDIGDAAKTFILNTKGSSVFAFYGKMGAGKTTFIKAVCEQLGVEETVTSPTFAIINEYYSAVLGRPIYHFDFYRIQKTEEVYDLGYEEYFFGGALCLIEWPEMVAGLLPENTVKVSITEDSQGRRTIEF